MTLTTFPIELKQLLNSNSATLKNNILESNYSFELNGKKSYNNHSINIAIVVNSTDLAIFEDYYHNTLKSGCNPFKASFIFLEEDIERNYIIDGGYTANHISKEIYKINFLVKEI